MSMTHDLLQIYRVISKNISIFRAATQKIPILFMILRQKGKKLCSFIKNIHFFFMKFYDSFYKILRNFMTLIVSQQQNTEACKTDNYVTAKLYIDFYYLFFHWILDLY